jgi:hypothetical protein
MDPSSKARASNDAICVRHSRAVWIINPPSDNRPEGCNPVGPRIFTPALSLLDGEAVACDDNGVTSFNFVRHRGHSESILLYAFDLIELNGDDLRSDPLQGRKATLEMILAKTDIRFNEHVEGDRFRRACKLGLEGIVSKRKHP